MNHENFKLVKKALKSHSVDKQLAFIDKSTLTPLLIHVVKICTGEHALPSFSFSEISRKFQILENTKTYIDELVITYLLFLGKILNGFQIHHIFQAPQTHILFDWLQIYKKVTYSIVCLIYNKKFTDQDWIHLDDMINGMLQGQSNAVRLFLKNIGRTDIVVDLEKYYMDTTNISAEHFGPLYWRMIHFMAEAIQMRKSANLAKTLWKEFLIYPFYRTLLCPICSTHYLAVLEKYKETLLETPNYANTWFEIHNYVNKSLNKSEYPSLEFEKDQSIMKNLLIG